MTITASITPARPAAPGQPITFSPAAIMARAHACAAERAAKPQPVAGRTGAEILASIEAALAEPARPELGAPLPSLTSVLSRRREIFGPVDLVDDADRMSAEVEAPDPIMPVIAELDRAADAFAEAWTDWVDVLSTFDPTGSTDWGDGADLVRQHLAPIAGPVKYQESWRQSRRPARSTQRPRPRSRLRGQPTPSAWPPTGLQRGATPPGRRTRGLTTRLCWRCSAP